MKADLDPVKTSGRRMSSKGLEVACEDHLTTMLNKVLWQLLVLSLGTLGAPILHPMPIYRISELCSQDLISKGRIRVC